jgi:hypothetical protein
MQNELKIPKPMLQCPDCTLKTRSEAAFTRHLMDEHAVRPNQVPGIVRRAAN